MDGFRRDVRFAFRTLVRAPSFTVVAVATLALGIGATTAIFSVLDGVLLRTLPYASPEELVTVWLDLSGRDGSDKEWFTPADLADYRADRGLFDELAGWDGWRPTLTGHGLPEVLAAAVVTHGMFPGVLGVQPFLGRSFLADEDRPGETRAVLLSHGFWQERFGADPSVLGRSLVLSEQPFTVVGVMPEGFRPPFVPGAEVWTTAQLDPSRCGRGCYTIRVIGRLAEGVSVPAARARGSAVAMGLAEVYPETNARVGVAIFELQEDGAGAAGRTLWILLGAVGFVLLIACTNVANLLLARGADRRSEFELRAALGAGRMSILRQLMTESVVLAALGGISGLGLAVWGTDALVGLAPATYPGLGRVSMDGRILLFTTVLTLGTGVVFGLFPALGASRSRVQARTRGDRLRLKLVGTLRDSLVVGQVAVALMLLVGAGLLLRSFHELRTADLGFDPQGVLTVTMSLPASRFAAGPDRTAYYGRLVDRLGALPGVISVGATSSLPLLGNDDDTDLRIEDEDASSLRAAIAIWVRRITRGYFYTVGQRLMEGRDFNDGDDLAATKVTIINESLARRYFDYPRRNPVGTRVAMGPDGPPIWRTIVGVAGDTRHFAIRDDGARPAMYVPYGQVSPTRMSIVVQTDGDPMALAEDARQAIASLDPSLAASQIARMTDLVDRTLQTDTFVTSLLTTFASLALALAAVGLYGVVSYGVTRRMREMGVRLAVGATGVEVRRIVARRGLGLAATGIGIGLVGAGVLTRVLEALVYDVSVTDPVTLMVAIGVLAVVAGLATWVPARRAGSADPASILREQ